MFFLKINKRKNMKFHIVMFHLLFYMFTLSACGNYSKGSKLINIHPLPLYGQYGEKLMLTLSTGSRVESTGKYVKGKVTYKINDKEVKTKLLKVLLSDGRAIFVPKKGLKSPDVAEKALKKYYEQERDYEVNTVKTYLYENDLKTPITVFKHQDKVSFLQQCSQKRQKYIEKGYTLEAFFVKVQTEYGQGWMLESALTERKGVYSGTGYQWETGDELVVWVDRLNVSQKPSLKDKPFTSLQQGEYMVFTGKFSVNLESAEILQKNYTANFVQVKLRTGKTGWVYLPAIQNVKALATYHEPEYGQSVVDIYDELELLYFRNKNLFNRQQNYEVDSYFAENIKFNLVSLENKEQILSSNATKLPKCIEKGDLASARVLLPYWNNLKTDPEKLRMIPGIPDQVGGTSDATLMHLAVKSGKVEVMQFLHEEMGLSYNSMISLDEGMVYMDMYPLDTALESNIPEVINFLISKKAESARGMIIAIEKNDVQLLRKLSYLKNFEGNDFALGRAVEMGNYSMVTYLVESLRYDPNKIFSRYNEEDDWIVTPMSLALQTGNEGIINYLRSKGGKAQ